MKAFIFFWSCFLISCFLCFGCTSEQTDKELSATGTAVVAEYNDCTVYYTKTKAPAQNVTWVRCGDKPKTVQTTHTESCGKGCVKSVTTTTVQEQ